MRLWPARACAAMVKDGPAPNVGRQIAHEMTVTLEHFARRAGWPWRSPARAPTDPDVRALAHPVPRPTGWPSTTGPEAIRSSDGDMYRNLDVLHMFPSIGSVGRRFASPPQGPPGRVPLLRRYYQSATTSRRPSRRTSLPSFDGTSAFTRSFRSPADECTAEARSWSPGSSSRDVAEETTGSPKFLGNPKRPFAMFSRRRQDRLHQTGTVQRHGPWYVKSRDSHERSFDAQIAWLSDALSTLRRAGYPVRRKTRFRPLVRRYRTGFHPQGSNERFQSASLHLILLPSPSFAWRNHIDRQVPLPPRTGTVISQSWVACGAIGG